jgi:hypothetical protein
MAYPLADSPLARGRDANPSGSCPFELLASGNR